MSDFPEIKRDLILQVESLTQEIAYNSEVCKKLLVKMFGDENAEPPIIGISQRVRDLEKLESNRERVKTRFVTMAITSLTISASGLVLFIFNSIREAFFKSGGH